MDVDKKRDSEKQVKLMNTYPQQVHTYGQKIHNLQRVHFYFLLQSFDDIDYFTVLLIVLH